MTNPPPLREGTSRWVCPSTLTRCRLTDNAANLWTIDDVEGVASGSWSGNFYNDGAGRNDGTPELVTGTFSVSHGSQGEVAHMIGAFQANNTHADTPSTDN